MSRLLIDNPVVVLWRSATGRVMCITFTGMLLGLAVDVLIAAKLGAGRTADALIIALSLPLLVDTVTREGTKFSMVPLFLERHRLLAKADFQRFTSGLVNVALLTGIAITALLEVSAPRLVASLAPGLPPDGKEEATWLLRVSAPLVIFAVSTTVLGVLLTAHRYFAFVALRNVFAPSIVIAAIGMVGDRHSIALWVGAGYAVGFGALFLTMLLGARKAGHRQQWTVWPCKDDLLRVWRAASLPTLGFILRQGSRVVERMFASLVAVGGVVTYYLAFRIFSAVQTLIGLSIAATGLPEMTDYDLAGNKSRVTILLRRDLTKATILSLPVVTMILVFNFEIVQWLFGRGLFGETSSRQTAAILVWLGAGLPLFCIVPVLSSGLYAKRAYGLVFRNMAVAVSVNIVLAGLLSQFLGLVGIAMAVSASTTVAVVNLTYLLYKSGVFVWEKERAKD